MAYLARGPWAKSSAAGPADRRTAPDRNTMDQLATRAFEFIQRHELIAPSETVLVGFSGGPDSVALALILEELTESRARPMAVQLAHLNHSLRGTESDGDEEFCHQFAQERGLALETQRVEPGKLARAGCSLEEAARRARYAFLLQVASRKGVKTIALAHQADDVAETVLMRVLRGCGVRGLGAVPPARPAGSPAARIVRPLLKLRKAELLDYLVRHGQPFRRDSSNWDTTFLRNRIRHELLPILEGECAADITGSLCELNAVAVEINALMDGALDSRWRGLCSEVGADEMAFDAEAYASLQPALRKLAVRRALEMLSPQAHDGPGLTRDHYEAVSALAERPVGSQLSLPGGFVARGEHGLILIRKHRGGCAVGSRGEAGKFSPPAELAVPGETAFPGAGARIATRVIGSPPGGPAELIARAGPHEVFLCLDALELPLTVRTRRPGDRFFPLGAPGQRKLKQFFVDRKVPRHRRDSCPLVVDAAGRIAWVVGHEIAEPFKLSGAGTRALHLKAEM